MNKEWHDYIFSKCDSQQYSLDADDDKCTSLAELERAYRELYTEVYKKGTETKWPNLDLMESYASPEQALAAGKALEAEAAVLERQVDKARKEFNQDVEKQRKRNELFDSIINANIRYMTT